MALPIVQFTGASGTECAMALTRMIVAGEFTEEAYADPVGMHLTMARTINWLLEGYLGPGIMEETDKQGEMALLMLQDSLGIDAQGLGGGVFRNLLIQKLVEMAMKYFEEWISRKTG